MRSHAITGAAGRDPAIFEGTSIIDDDASEAGWRYIEDQRI
jgi:hypothetical protein